jgi:hypothetical protein
MMHRTLLTFLLCSGLVAQAPPKPAAGQEPPASQPSKPDAKATSRTTEAPPEPEPKAEDLKLPASANLEDIRAARGAQQMLAAEAKLKQQIKAGKLAGADRLLSFEEISSWPYQDGLKGMPESVKKLDGQKVLMTGFMLPIDEVENIKQFLLVQSLWSCCFGQPPDINGIVRVVYKGKKKLDYQYEPIKVIGTFHVKATVEDGYCVDIYQLETESVEVMR